MSAGCNYHTCGHSIWKEYNWTGHRHAPVYRDNEEESPTAGEVITNCPSCGEWLSEDVVSIGLPATWLAPPAGDDEAAERAHTETLLNALDETWGI